MPEQIEVSGLTELRETMMKTLPQALQGKASQAALTKAAKPIIAAAQARAPTRKPRGFIGPMLPGKTRGNLRKSIYSYRSPESTRTYEARFIGVKGKAWYWRFIEFGRASVERAKGSLGTPIKGFFGKKVVAVPAKPFLRPAFDENANRAIEIYQQALLPAIEKVARQGYASSQRRLRKYITGF